MEPNERKTMDELDQALDAADKAAVNGLGHSLHILAHPIKYGPGGVVDASISIAFHGFYFATTNAIRLFVAAERAEERMKSTAESARESPPNTEPPSQG